MVLQAPRRWVSSPFGYNILLAVCGGSSQLVHKYVQLNELLKVEKELTIKNVLYHSPCLKSVHILKNPNPVIDLHQITTLDVYKNWIKGHNISTLENVDDIPSHTELILSSICIFKGLWNVSEVSSGSLMKIYNSYNYTQDVKYEVRMLELPIHDQNFKLVIIVPNEADVLQALFEKLNKEGLTAAINSVQPLFTATSELTAPCIHVVSKLNLNYMNIIPVVTSAVQYGTVKIDNDGVLLKVLTCLSSSPKTPSISEELKARNPFYFAITYRDTPIFTGQYAQV